MGLILVAGVCMLSVVQSKLAVISRSYFWPSCFCQFNLSNKELDVKNLSSQHPQRSMDPLVVICLVLLLVVSCPQEEGEEQVSESDLMLLQQPDTPPAEATAKVCSGKKHRDRIRKGRRDERPPRLVNYKGPRMALVRQYRELTRSLEGAVGTPHARKLIAGLHARNPGQRRLIRHALREASDEA